MLGHYVTTRGIESKDAVFVCGIGMRHFRYSSGNYVVRGTRSLVTMTISFRSHSTLA
jgi:hypothetical protein